MYRIECQCGARFRLKPQFLGRAIPCPKCKAMMRPVCGGGQVGDFDARLVIEAGPQRVGEQVFLAGEGTIEIGKMDGKPIQLLGTQVSRNHCRLVQTCAGEWKIEDNRSTNGLFVNDQRIEAAELKNGDRIRIGEFVLRYDCPREPQEPQDDMYGLAAMEAAAPAVQVAEAPVAVQDAAVAVAAGTTCPSCSRMLPAGSKICVQCGIDLKTGRAILTSKGVDEDLLAERTDTWIRVISWLVCFGLFPIASEAFGTRKPLATWVITGITVVASLLFLPVAWGLVERSSASLNLMLWSGSRSELERQYKQALDGLAQLEGDTIAPKVRQPAGRIKTQDLDEEDVQGLQAAIEEGIRQAAPPEVAFHWYQLFTSALLHEGIFHLAGNLLFLLVFGLRVNELMGSLRMAVIYPLLAAISGAAHHLASADGPMSPMLGASGAVMGLAGMYLVFFPRHKVHMAIWIRLGILTGWRCFYKVFRMNGFWLLLLWIGFNDVLFVALGLDDHVAHWAHLGGFLGGMAVALGLLFSRQVSARGGDLVSMFLGKRAWALVGKPTAA